MNVQMRLITADTIDSLTTAGKRSLGEFKTWATKPLPDTLMTIQENIPEAIPEPVPEANGKEKVEQLLNQPLTDEEYKVLSEPLEEYDPPLTEEPIPNSQNPELTPRYNITASESKNPIPTIKYQSKEDNFDMGDDSIDSLEKVTNKIPNVESNAKSKDSSIFNIDTNANGEYTIESRDPSVFNIDTNAESISNLDSNSEEKSDSNSDSASSPNDDKKVIKITKT
jgi:hypothetical protein